MAVPFALIAVKKVDTVQSLVKKIDAFIQNLQCRLKGSCSPKFTAAIAATGGTVGYKRVRFENGKRLEWWFLNTTEFLSWDNAAPNSMKAWYQASGYWDKLRAAGLDPCCLKQSFPPAEAFPDRGEFGGITEIYVDGVKVQVDKVSYDPSVHKFETLAAAGDYTVDDKTKTVSSTQPGQNGLGLLALAGLGIWFLPKFLKN